jgi:CelD/BcsL family acetyltransferase involved in cellulose biosynthesis
VFLERLLPRGYGHSSYIRLVDTRQREMKKKKKKKRRRKKREKKRVCVGFFL